MGHDTVIQKQWRIISRQISPLDGRNVQFRKNCHLCSKKVVFAYNFCFSASFKSYLESVSKEQFFDIFFNASFNNITSFSLKPFVANFKYLFFHINLKINFINLDVQPI